MNIVRKYKISKLINKPLEGIEGECISFMKNILDDLIPFTYEEFPKSIFYMNSNGVWMFEQNNKDNIFYVNYFIIWSILVEKYSMEIKDIQIFIKYMVEESFKQKVATPFRLVLPIRASAPPQNKVEKAFKQKVLTPMNRSQIRHIQAEEAFKQNVSTPDIQIDKRGYTVEEAFKEQVSTPMKKYTYDESLVEEAFKQKYNI